MVDRAARELVSLGVTRLRQGGQLNVRQRELTRRALARAGEARGWSARAVDRPYPVAEIRRDVEVVIERGFEARREELAVTVAAKRSELSDLEEVAASVRALGENEEPGYPAEIRYAHTTRDPVLGLVTTVETHTVGDLQDAESLAGTIEKNLSRWDRLREKMLAELEEEERLLAQLTLELPDFVDSLEDLVRDVLVTLP